MSEFFPVQKTILSCEAIKDKILSQYDIEQDHTCRFIRHGLNDTYKIHNDKNTYYLRVYRYNWRSRNDIISEIKLLNQLEKNDQISVAAPVIKNNGEYYTEVNAPEGKRYAVLFNSAVGADRSKYVFDAKKSYNYGKTLAKIHLEADKSKKLDRFHIDLDHLLTEPLKDLKPFFSKNIQNYEYLENISEKLSRKIDKLLTKDKTYFGIIHGDFHSGNIFLDENDNPSVFDFDCFGYGWRAYDISVFLWSLWVFQGFEQKDKAKRTRLWNSFLKGYSEVKALTKEEIKAAFVFVPIRHIWLLGVHAYSSDDWGAEYLQDNFFNSRIAFIKKWIEYFNVLPERDR